MDILGKTVTISVLFQVMDTLVSKDVSVVNPSVTFLPGAILNKKASLLCDRYYVYKTKHILVSFKIPQSDWQNNILKTAN